MLKSVGMGPKKKLMIGKRSEGCAPWTDGALQAVLQLGDEVAEKHLVSKFADDALFFAGHVQQET